MGIVFFHELSQSKVDELVNSHKTWGDIMEEFKQPEWCSYHNALEGELGCWSLVDIRQGGLREKISPEFCKDCDCFISKTKMT